MRSGDFDGGAIWFLPSNTPTVLLQNNFSSAAAEQAYSYNWPHMKDPAVDRLIDAVSTAGNEADFLAAIHALDRVLLWNFYFMPGTSRSSYGVVWWDKFGYKKTEPRLRLGYRDTWWWDEAKAAKVRDYLGRSGR
jgi:microcin C transport system substrate-binding protein